MTDLKTCSSCKQEKPTPEFYVRKASPDGLNARCKTCFRAAQNTPKALEKRRERMRAYYHANPEFRQRQLATSYQRSMKHQYKLTLEQLNDMTAKQSHCCAICGERVEGRLDVDHDHACCDSRKTCGECIRELLCRRCNSTLGKVHDSIEILESMIAYLRKHEAKGY